MCSTDSPVSDLRLRRKLNAETRGVAGCAWPGCEDREVGSTVKVQGYEMEGRRIGVLCMKHAGDVAMAWFEEGVHAAKLHEFLTREVVPVDNRGLDRLRREKEQAQIVERQRGDSLGFVYYVRIGDRIKIGFSTDVKKRMRSYPPRSELLAVEPGDFDVERKRHLQFQGSRADGREWFTPTQDILDHCNSLIIKHGSPKRHAHHYRKNENPVRLSRRP
jgi:hypothetical protein